MKQEVNYYQNQNISLVHDLMLHGLLHACTTVPVHVHSTCTCMHVITKDYWINNIGKHVYKNKEYQFLFQFVFVSELNISQSSLRLLYSKMSIDAGVSSSPSEVLVLTIRYMLLTTSITIFLGKTKINDEQLHKWKQHRNVTVNKKLK